jgi:LAS superfamily LD-carboxypeptidase LdcB
MRKSIILSCVVLVALIVFAFDNIYTSADVKKIPKDITSKNLEQNNYPKNLGKENTSPSNQLSDSILLNHLLGRFDYKTDTSFTLVKIDYCTKTMYLQKEVYQKFIDMHNAAKKENITLLIVSGTRNFNEQKDIWERKWDKYIKTKDSLSTVRQIMLYSSMPTTSRHHWGTDIDINSVDPAHFNTKQGIKEYKWLVNNAHKFGFCQVYTDKSTSKRTGYEMEKWHWSYTPISSRYLKKYNELVNYKLVNGFKGSYFAPKIKSIENFVNGIDQSCHH